MGAQSVYETKNALYKKFCLIPRFEIYSLSIKKKNFFFSSTRMSVLPIKTKLCLKWGQC